MNNRIEVAHLVTEARAGTDIDLTIATVLHDAIEDARITAAQISALFAPEVAHLVLEVTDDRSLLPATRKRLQLEPTPHKSPKAKMIRLAAMTSNLRSFRVSPPPWQMERKREYLRWSRAVVAGARGVNTQLEAVFHNAALELERVPESQF